MVTHFHGLSTVNYPKYTVFSLFLKRGIVRYSKSENNWFEKGILCPEISKIENANTFYFDLGPKRYLGLTDPIIGGMSYSLGTGGK